MKYPHNDPFSIFYNYDIQNLYFDVQDVHFDKWESAYFWVCWDHSNQIFSESSPQISPPLYYKKLFRFQFLALSSDKLKQI